LGNYASGLYPVEALSSNEEMPPELQLHPVPLEPMKPDSDPLKVLERADAFIARSEALPNSVRGVLVEHFINVRAHSSLTVYVRKASGLTSFK
jgi:hypothetical protein